MLDVLLKAFMEHSDNVEIASQISMDPGPAYLLVNALAITGMTYIVSFRFLNVSKCSQVAFISSCALAFDGTDEPPEKCS